MTSPSVKLSQFKEQTSPIFRKEENQRAAAAAVKMHA
jgi:hypothetical protein